MREFRQVGIELIGVDAPGGTIEVIELLVGALDAIGLDRAVVGLGDADLFRQLLDELEVAGPARDRILACLQAHDLVAIEAEAGDLAGDRSRRADARSSRSRTCAAAPRCSSAPAGSAATRSSCASSRLAETYEGLAERGIAERVQLDLGLLRDLDYYTGAILEVYDPALGHVLGGGGRYDDLIGRFGRPMPAAGFALYTERLHIAQAEEEKLTAQRASGREGDG